MRASERMVEEVTSSRGGLEPVMAGLYAAPPRELPFAPGVDVRAFLLRRPAGNLLVYAVDGLAAHEPALRALGGVERQYLGHWHEATFAADGVGAPVVVNERDRAPAAARTAVRAGFSLRHAVDGDLEAIPIPGHTPGATAFLWDGGEHRYLFTGDTIWLDGDEWVAAVLDSSDRAAYLESLALVRELDFDVLVPWAATRGGPYLAPTDEADRRRRIDALVERVGRGEDR